jgi:pyruvate dehydrogenase E1 component alpha subunit
MVKAMGIEVGIADGMDIQASKRLMKESVDRVRDTAMPFFIEFSTYRWREHCGHAFDNDIGYRTTDEFLTWQAKDPLHYLETQLNNSSPSMQNSITELKSTIDTEVNVAFDFAENSPFPDQREAYDGVYA